MNNTRDFKDGAKIAAQYLAEHGIQVPHTRILEALSRAFGERNWSTLRAQLDAPATAETAPEWDPSKGPMPQALYISHGGNRCPFCGSFHLESEDLEADGPLAWDTTNCDSCGKSWTSDYKLCGFRSKEMGSTVGAQNARSDVVEDLVDDVKRRARKYEFSCTSFENAKDLAQESADALGIDDVTEQELAEAASRLYD